MNKQYTKDDIIELLLKLNFECNNTKISRFFTCEHCSIYIPIDIKENIQIRIGLIFHNYTPTEAMQFININFYKRLRKLKIEKLLNEQE